MLGITLLSLDAAGGGPAHAQPLAPSAPRAPSETRASFVGAVPLAAGSVEVGSVEAASVDTGAPSMNAASKDAASLDPAVLDMALGALECARRSGSAGERADKVLSVIDFRLPSSTPRLWVIDLDSGATLFTERVSHGRNTGEDAATAFSNIPGSNQSSLGLFRTGEIYVGKHGRSMKLDGLEPGFNDRARDRAIVVHAASYCTGEHVAQWGRLGRSQGCPALDPAVSDAVIDTIRDGTLLFAYYPDPDWLSGSSALRCEGAEDPA
ncbi:MAG: murein L,D-transpeptidase catalytic domain family protein [Myxococcota bacterium]